MYTILITLQRLTLLALCHSATVNEDYLDVEMNITFVSGQNASGDNQQCFFVPILDDDILECNETFDVLVSPITEDENIVNITAQLITVTIEEDPNDCMFTSVQNRIGMMMTMHAYH